MKVRLCEIWVVTTTVKLLTMKIWFKILVISLSVFFQEGQGNHFNFLN